MNFLLKKINCLVVTKAVCFLHLIYLYSIALFKFFILQILSRATSHFKVGCGYRATVLAVGDNNLELTIAGN